MEIGIISTINVFPPSFGAAVRIFQIAKNLGELGCSVNLFIPQDEGTRNVQLRNVEIHRCKELSNIVYPIDIPGILALSESFVRSMKKLGFYKRVDLIQSEALTAAPYGLMLKKLLGKPAILDEHNVETRLWYRINKVKKRRWKRLRLLEALSCKNFNHVLTVSLIDKRMIHEFFSVPPSKIDVISNGVDVQHFSPKNGDRERIRSKYGLRDEPIVLFTGRLSWFPNVDATKMILSEIYPALKKLIPEVVFMTVGTRPPSWLISHKSKDFIVTGDVDDVAPYINAADVCIAPLRFGSGTRLKILEFMACEKPVVSTNIGAEGLDVINRKHIIIEDSPTRFVDWITRLIEDKKFAVNIGKSARILIQRQYNWKSIVKKLISVYKTLYTNL